VYYVLVVNVFDPFQDVLSVGHQLFVLAHGS
jgi:hypothetical protein